MSKKEMSSSSYRNNLEILLPLFLNKNIISLACGKGYLNIVKLLFEHGADIEIENKYGSTCLNTGK
jgi:ankyrin repeat protein